MSYYVHPQALCESLLIGDGTRIWAFAHVLPGARIGARCNICDHVFIENDVCLGDGVTVKCGVQIWDGVTLEDGVFVGPNATFTNDPAPPNRGRSGPFVATRTLVRKHASIGANATVLPGVEIGESALVGAGAVVTRSVPAHAVVVGNPARVFQRAAVVDADPLAEAIKLESLPQWWRQQGFMPERMQVPDGAVDPQVDQWRCAVLLRGEQLCQIRHRDLWMPLPCAANAINVILLPPGSVLRTPATAGVLWQVWTGSIRSQELPR